jgi:hypothetical protein
MIRGGTSIIGMEFMTWVEVRWVEVGLRRE